MKVLIILKANISNFDMSWKAALRQYATQPNPENLPSALRFSHNKTSLTIFDAYPKSIFHFLILARPTEEVPANVLADLRTLLRSDKQRAKATLLALKQTSQEIQLQIEKEMVKKIRVQVGNLDRIPCRAFYVAFTPSCDLE